MKTNKTILQKEIEKILTPVITGENCPKTGKCNCIEIATKAILSKLKEAHDKGWQEAQDMFRKSR